MKPLSHPEISGKDVVGFPDTIYLNGYGVPIDLSMCYLYLVLATANGLEEATSFRNKVAELLSPSQIDQVQKVAEKWKFGELPKL